MSSADYLKIKFLNNSKLQLLEEFDKFLPFSKSSLYKKSIVEAQLLTNGLDVKTIYNLTINLKNVAVDFVPGNTIGIFPCNDEDEVISLIERLGIKLNADVICVLNVSSSTSKKNAKIPKHLPRIGTIKKFLMEFVDIRSPPKKLLLKTLARFASDEDKEKLNFICSPAGSSEYNKFICGKGRTLLNILQTFQSCTPPIERLLEHLPPLQPRIYSISSSPLQTDIIKITFSVIQHDDGTKGICTGYLEKLAKKCLIGEKPKLEFYFRQTNNFVLPSDPLTPIIMIGPGTGVAPFIGFLQHRLLQKINNNINFGKAWLFFGCRYSNRDYLYKSELQNFLNNDVLSKLFVSFSREQEHKVYVQDNIENNGKELVEMILNENAVIYVCGDANNMAISIRKAISNCLCTYGNVKSEEVDDFMLKLQKNNRYIIDVWI